MLSLAEFEQQQKERKASQKEEPTQDLRSILDPYGEQKQSSANKQDQSKEPKAERLEDEFPSLGGGPKKGGEEGPGSFNFKPKDPFGLEIAVSQHVKKSEAPTSQQKKPKTTKVEEKNEKSKDE